MGLQHIPDSCDAGQQRAICWDPSMAPDDPAEPPAEDVGALCDGRVRLILLDDDGGVAEGMADR